MHLVHIAQCIHLKLFNALTYLKGLALKILNVRPGEINTITCEPTEHDGGSAGTLMQCNVGVLPKVFEFFFFVSQ